MSLQLKDCTKSELLFVIRQLRFHCGSSGEYYLMQALGDVRRQRLEAIYAKASRLSSLSAKKREEYIETLSPYEGMKLKDIPLSVLEEADAAIKEAQEADRKWNALMRREVKLYE